MKSREITLRKGFAIPFAVIVFAVIATVSGIVHSLFVNNLSMAVRQEKNVQAYYAALSGLEMGTGALFTPIPNPNAGVVGAPDMITLLDIYRDSPNPLSMIGTLEDTIILPNGRVNVKIRPVMQGGPPAQLWIRVEAEGVYIDEGINPSTLSGRNEYTHSGTISYRADNPAVFERRFGA